MEGLGILCLHFSKRPMATTVHGNYNIEKHAEWRGSSTDNDEVVWCSVSLVPCQCRWVGSAETKS